MLSREERFWAKVNKNGPAPLAYPELGSCWLWKDRDAEGSYGLVAVRVAPGIRRTWGAHKIAFILSGGELSSEKPWVLHKCDVPPCVRPAHLFAGSAKDNTRDAMRKGRFVVPKPQELTRRITADFMSGMSLFKLSVKYGLSTGNISNRLRTHSLLVVKDIAS